MSQDHGDSPTISTHPKTAPLRKNSGFKLPSVAYSPNPNEHGDDSEEDEEDEDETDDENDDNISLPRGMLGTRSTMTLSPPKLPLLFFEEDSIGQIDFAYQTSGAPSSTHSQTSLTGLNGRKSSEKPDLNARRGADERSRSHSSTRGMQIEQSSGTERTANTSEPVLVRKSSPRPFTPPINTAFPKKQVSDSVNQQVQSSDKDEGDTSGEQGVRGHSFYWHSPGSGSSSDEEDNPLTSLPNGTKSGHKADSQSENSKKEVPTEPVIEPLIIRPIINTIPESSLTSATALGFGGPSDWQHFNDYDAEEVDDLALYISDKPKTVELPAGTPVKEDGEKLDPTLSPRRLVGAERDTLPTIQERASEILEDGKGSEASQIKTSDRSSAASTGSQGSLQKSIIERTITQQSSLINQDDSGVSIQSSLKPEEDILDTGAKKSSNESMISQTKKEGEATGSDKKRAVPPHVTHSRVTSDPSVQSSGLNSPVDEDDGRERIIISLQMPDGEKDKKNKEPSPPRTTGNDDGSRERNLAIATNLEPKTVESPELLRTGRMSVFPQSIEMENPYAGLDPWAKASLNRYVKLLKEEAAAQSDEEKFTLFIKFMDRERRNRTALYDMDEDSENESTLQFNKITDDSGKIRSRVSLKRKAAPVIPDLDTMPVQALQTEEPARADTMPLQRPGATNERQNSEGSLSNLKAAEKNQQPMTAPLQQASFTGAAAADDSYVTAETPNEDKPQSLNTRQVKEKGSGTFTDRESTYIRDKAVKEKSSGKTGLSLSALKKKALDLGGRSIAKDRNTTPINLQTLLMKASDDSKKPASPVLANRTAPPLTTPTPPPPPPVPNVEPQAAATPEKRDNGADKADEAEGRQYEGDKAANRQTIYRPFSGHLRQRSVLRSNPESKRSSVFDRKSLAAEASFPRSPINALDAKPFEEHQKPRTKPVNYRYTILEPLLLVVPQEGITHAEPQQLTRLRQSMDAIRDDFSFIHKTVLSWDADAKKGRERNDKERQSRTAQNEARIDALFNENEIGYGDISQLEAEFKRQEATKKAQEDRDEVDTFVANVFDVVWKRINYEMDQLQPLYDQCTELVSNASAGRTMFEDFEDTVPVASAMEVLLILYQKLMVRHQKAFEAVLERDRRLKKTEVAPWNAMGSNEKVKKIEKRFEDAEKKAILEFCRQRDDRAGVLMEVLDHNTLRGVGANQDYMESIMQAVRKISTEVQASGNSIANDDVVSQDEVLKAQTITTSLARSSEQLVQTFHVADMLLNAADYEVSVANAKLSNADAAAFKRLREAKAKEDTKLVMDLEHRMNLIRGDTSRTQEEIKKLLSLISRKTDSSEALPRGSIEKQSASSHGLEDQDRGSRVMSKGAEEITNNKARRLPRKLQ